MTRLKQKQGSEGFTMIELLVVLVLISILSAIAIAQYREYVTIAFDSRAEAVLREVANAQEVYYADHFAYKACTQADCSALLGIRPFEADVNFEFLLNGDGFTGTASHSQGTGKTFSWPVS